MFLFCGTKYNPSMSGQVDFELRDGIGFITFFHPAHNSFPSTQLKALSTLIQEKSQDAAVSVLVLQSAGEKSFCAGANFEEMLAIETPEQGTAFFGGFAGVINAMRQCPKFIIGRVQGKTIGGGVGLAAACDYCLASKNAAIRLSELSIGIGPFVIGPVVERKIGTAALAELSLDAENFRPAEWALGKGFYAAIFEDIPNLDAAVSSLAEKLAAYSPEAMHEWKKVLWQGTDNWDQLLAERAATSAKLNLSEAGKKALEKYR
jgi:methylglutaconyl-CoA hydratase